MHNIEPYYRWLDYYEGSEDENSPFFGKEYNYDQYSDHIYGYYIDPAWDYIGSETLYIKILFVSYEEGACIIEFIGEWNDTLHNDVMHLKRNILDELALKGITKYILIGENVLNFHGSDDSYYEEWFDDVSDGGWIVALNFRDFVLDEWAKYNVDNYVISGGVFDDLPWRTHHPMALIKFVELLISRRLGE